MAGEAGMNLVASTLVGCISCLGGGTLNNLLYGTSALLDRPGVNWVRNPTVFYVAVLASMVTFFAWPVYCRHQAQQELRTEFELHGELEDNGSVSQAAFCRACWRDPAFKQRVVSALDTAARKTREASTSESLFHRHATTHANHPPHAPGGSSQQQDSSSHDSHHAAHHPHHALVRHSTAPSDKPLIDPTIDPALLFELVDTDHSGYIEIEEMQFLIGHKFNASPIMYGLDTLALSALAVTGVHMAIVRGLHPLVAATSGITICFGGIARDVLCGRHLAVGGQSYGTYRTIVVVGVLERVPRVSSHFSLSLSLSMIFYCFDKMIGACSCVLICDFFTCLFWKHTQPWQPVPDRPCISCCDNCVVLFLGFRKFPWWVAFCYRPVPPFPCDCGNTFKENHCYDPCIIILPPP